MQTDRHTTKERASTNEKKKRKRMTLTNNTMLQFVSLVSFPGRHRIAGTMFRAPKLGLRRGKRGEARDDACMSQIRKSKRCHTCTRSHLHIPYTTTYNHRTTSKTFCVFLRGAATLRVKLRFIAAAAPLVECTPTSASPPS